MFGETHVRNLEAREEVVRNRIEAEGILRREVEVALEAVHRQRAFVAVRQGEALENVLQGFDAAQSVVGQAPVRQRQFAEQHVAHVAVAHFHRVRVFAEVGTQESRHQHVLLVATVAVGVAKFPLQTVLVDALAQPPADDEAVVLELLEELEQFVVVLVARQRRTVLAEEGTQTDETHRERTHLPRNLVRKFFLEGLVLGIENGVAAEELGVVFREVPVRIHVDFKVLEGL